MMKLSPWKPALVVIFALCVLVFSIYLFRQKPETVVPQAKRYPHEHLRTPALEPSAELRQVNYTIRNGETLTQVAKLRYGHQYYYSVIKLHNRLADEAQVTANDTLWLPDMVVVLAEEDLTRVIAPEVTLILCSRAKYDRVVKQLWTLRSESSGNYQLPEDIRRELLEAADDLQQATDSLKQARPGMAAPQHMIGQLEQNISAILALAGGEHSDPNGYDIDMVQQRYALALTYAITWAREGFK